MSAVPDDGPHILLVRHGETEYNRIGRCQGWTDQPLNETGLGQAKAVAQKLAARRVAQIVASPLQRASMTASAIAEAHALDIAHHEGLRELYHGTLEGVPFAELDDHVPGIREAWRTEPHNVCMPDGETLAELQERAWRAFEELAEAHLHRHDNGGPKGHLVLVAHALTIGTLVCKLKGEQLDTMRNYRLLPCGYWEVHRRDDAWHVHQADGLMPMDTKV